MQTFINQIVTQYRINGHVLESVDVTTRYAWAACGDRSKELWTKQTKQRLEKSKFLHEWQF